MSGEVNSVKFDYAGHDLLAQAGAEIDKIGMLDFDQSVNALKNLNKAVSLGLNMGDTALATLAAFTVVDQILNDAYMWKNISPEWTDEVATQIERYWLGRVPLLEVDEQLIAYRIIDRVFGGLLSHKNNKDNLRRAEKIQGLLPVPAPAIAYQLFWEYLDTDNVSDACISKAEIVEKYSFRPAERARLAQFSAMRNYQYAVERQKHSGKTLRGLEEVHEFDEFLTRHFGADYCANKVGFFGSSKKKLELTEDMAELYKRLTMAAIDAPGTPWTSMYTKFLQARIDAGTNELKRARKAFTKLYDAGFAIRDTAAQLAFVCNFLKDSDSAARVIRDTADKLMYLRGEITTKHILGELYLDAGGDPANLGIEEFPAHVVARCNGSYDLIANEFSGSLKSNHDKVIKEYWANKEKLFQKFIAETFTAGHFDAAYGNGEMAAATMQLEYAPVGSFGVDELPVLDVLDRKVLIDACAHPVRVDAVVRQIVKYIEHQISKGATFEQLAKSYPGFGLSASVCLAQMKPHLDKADFKEITALLDFAGGLPGATDLTKASLFAAALPVLSKDRLVMPAFERGKSLFTGLKDAKALSLLESSIIEQGFVVLNSADAQAEWLGVCEALLTVSSGDDVQSRLVGWLNPRLSSGSVADSDIRIGEVVMGLLGDGHREHLRVPTRDALNRMMMAASDKDVPGIFKRLWAIASQDAFLPGAIAEWFVSRHEGSHAESTTALGEWLVSALPEGEAREAVRNSVVLELVSRLKKENDGDFAKGLIERLMKHSTGESGPAAAISDWYVAWNPAVPDPTSEKSDMGEWLRMFLRGGPLAVATGVCVESLEAELADPAKKRQRLKLLERLSEVLPDDAGVTARLMAARKARTMFWVKFSLIAAAGIGVVIALAAVFGN
ncbi:MAG: hypothetical protein ACOX51_02425 [Myxococcota bacterium]|jgi:hypothetical protein